MKTTILCYENIYFIAVGIQTQHKRENWETGRRRREERKKDRDLSSRNTNVVYVKR